MLEKAEILLNSISVIFFGYSIFTVILIWYSYYDTEDGMTKEEAALQKCCRAECVVILQLPCNLLCAVMFYKNCSDRWSTHYKIMVQEEATLKKYQIKVTTFITSEIVSWIVCWYVSYHWTLYFFSSRIRIL